MKKKEIITEISDLISMLFIYIKNKKGKKIAIRLHEKLAIILYSNLSFFFFSFAVHLMMVYLQRRGCGEGVHVMQQIYLKIEK